MSRDLLHVSKLEEFKAWLDTNGVKHRPGRGDYQVLQVELIGTDQWACIYERNKMPEHFTVDKRLDRLVVGFCRWSRKYRST